MKFQRPHNWERGIRDEERDLKMLKMIKVKRVYEETSPQDDGRFLVERLGRRGMKKEALHRDGWVKEAGSITTLRRWYSHDLAKWGDFRERYFAELDETATTWQPLVEAARGVNVMLLYSARDTEYNNALALKEYLEKKLAR